MHFVALNEVFILLETCGRVGDVRPDVLIQVPAEVLVRHREEQSEHLGEVPACCLQGSYTTGGWGGGGFVPCQKQACKRRQPLSV